MALLSSRPCASHRWRRTGVSISRIARLPRQNRSATCPLFDAHFDAGAEPPIGAPPWIRWVVAAGYFLKNHLYLEIEIPRYLAKPEAHGKADAVSAI